MDTQGLTVENPDRAVAKYPILLTGCQEGHSPLKIYFNHGRTVEQSNNPFGIFRSEPGTPALPKAYTPGVLEIKTSKINVLVSFLLFIKLLNNELSIKEVPMTRQTKSMATKSERSNPRTGTENHSLHPCLWMQAGVVKKKNCNHYYDCATCKYDTAMLKMAATGRHISWQDAMRKHDSRDRTCRHTMTGRADHRNCPMNYNCNHCDFDQIFEDTLSPATAHGLGKIEDIKGFKLDPSGYFHSGHTWARIEEGGFIRVGMDDFAFKVLGSPDGFDLPLTGKELNQSQAGWGIKQRDNFADVLSPINGVITSVNHGVRKSPNLPEQDPYRDGWLFTVHNSDTKEALKTLMADGESSIWLNREVTTLEQMIEEVTGPLSADGGYLRSGVYANLPTLGWRNLTRKFLGI